MNKLVIGLGTGRCGTRSLAKFLTKHGVRASHERFRLVWKPDAKSCEEAIDIMLGLCDWSGDVAFYWLNYVKMVLDYHSDTRFICLKRNKKDVVRSYLRTINDPIKCCMIWTKHTKESKYRLCDNLSEQDIENMDESTREWVEAYWKEEFTFNNGEFTNHFPKYDLEDKEAYLKRFYDDYYVVAEKLAKDYPNNFKIFDMLTTLNTKQGQTELLNFIGVIPNTVAQ